MDLALDFGTPEHGWLDVTLRLGDAVWTDNVSDVPCDSLGDLARALVGLASGGGEQRVAWSLEPAWATWVLRPEADALVVTVLDGDRTLWSRRCPREAVLRVCLQGLDRLGADPAWARTDADRTVWSWPLPADSLARLWARIA
ncbi:MAG: hypothetical protein AAF845_05450 [Bacteroidota bacterium]